MSLTNTQINVLMRRCHETRTGLSYVDELLEEAGIAMGLLLTENKNLAWLAEHSTEKLIRMQALNEAADNVGARTWGEGKEGEIENDLRRMANGGCALCGKTMPRRTNMEKTQIDMMVNRFLSWKLPAGVCPDACTMMRDYPHPLSGTNLLTANQAREMIEYMLTETPNAEVTGA